MTNPDSVAAGAPLCACGCGERVERTSRRFRRYHHLRLVPPKPKRPQACSRCATCAARFSHAAGRPVARYCTVICKARAMISKPRPRPTAPFNAFIFDGWCDSGLSLRGYAKALGLSIGWLDRALAGAAPTHRTWEHLAAICGDALPRPAVTDTERRRAAMRAVQADLHAQVRSGQRTLRGFPHRGGWRMPAEAVARSRASKAANRRADGRTVAEHEAEHLRALGRDWRIRVIRSLNLFLVRHPDPLDRDRYKEAAQEAARRLGTPRAAKAVWAHWQPRLVEKGLMSASAGGRPADVARCRRIRAHLDAAGITPETARAPYGFWKVSGHAEPAAKGPRPNGDQQGAFWREHACPECREDRRLRARKPVKLPLGLTKSRA